MYCNAWFSYYLCYTIVGRERVSHLATGVRLPGQRVWWRWPGSVCRWPGSRGRADTTLSSVGSTSTSAPSMGTAQLHVYSSTQNGVNTARISNMERAIESREFTLLLHIYTPKFYYLWIPHKNREPWDHYDILLVCISPEQLQSRL